jgi:mobilome CxxCx(11)CxxC protein
MLRTDATDRICSDCWDRAIYAYGTGELFLKRSRRYANLLQGLSFFGIVVPLLIGGVVLAFGTQASYLQLLITIAAGVGILQLLFSAWSIVYNWPDNLQYALESAAENFDLSVKFKEIGEQCQSPADDLDIRFAALKARDDSRRMADARRAVTAKELRYAHRAGLRQFGRACDECHEVPRAMEASKCHTCGRF